MTTKFCQRIKFWMSLATIIVTGSIYAQSSSETVSHIVKKGETVYGISKQYNIPLETIYQLNPSAKRGVKKGDTLLLPKTNYTETSETKNKSKDTKISSEIKKETKGSGDVDIEKLKKENSENVKSKEKKKDKKSKQKEDNKEEILPTENFSKEDTDGSLYKNEDLSIEEGFTNLDESQPTEEIKEEINQPVKIVLLLDDPNSKKDIDFTRGLLTGIERFKEVDYKIDLKIMDGRISTGNILNELDDFEPDLIITTADKTFPLFLADYGNTNQIEVVNVFDLKNDLYEDNPSIIQMLPPSEYFNKKMAKGLYKENHRRKIIFIGEEDPNDGIAVELLNLYGGEVQKMSLEEFGSYEPDLVDMVVLYSFANKKEEVADFLNNVDNLTDNNPGLDVRLIGRLSWIAMLGDYEDKFKEYSAFIPARVWIDEDAENWKKFNESFEILFGGLPIRSIPNFAASGFDIINYFIPRIKGIKQSTDTSQVLIQESGLQNEIKLRRIENGGFINDVGYIVRFRRSGENDKIIVE